MNGFDCIAQFIKWGQIYWSYNFWITLGDGGAVIRSMSLNQTASDPRTINGSAKVEGEARAALKDGGFEGLIAQPTH